MTGRILNVESAFVRKARRQGGTGMEEAIAAAEKRVANMSDRAMAEVDACIARAGEAAGRLAEGDATAIEALRSAADTIVGLSGLFSLDGLAKAATSLCILIDWVGGEIDAKAVRVHPGGDAAVPSRRRGHAGRLHRAGSGGAGPGQRPSGRAGRRRSDRRHPDARRLAALRGAFGQGLGGLLPLQPDPGGGARCRRADRRDDDGDAEEVHELRAFRCQNRSHERRRHESSRAGHGAVEAGRRARVLLFHAGENRRGEGRHRHRHPQRDHQEPGQHGRPIGAVVGQGSTPRRSRKPRSTGPRSAGCASRSSPPPRP